MKTQKVLVVGASGTVGSEVVRLLREAGHSVRATTSKATGASDGIERVRIDVGTGEGIHAAFEGVDRAFLLSPPGYADMYKTLSPLIQEAKRRGLKKVVLMTALGANASESTPFRRAELELERSGLAYNIVRPNWFMQNFNTFWVQGIRQNSQIALPAGQAKTSFIDAHDISAVVAKLMTDDSWNNQAFDITGPQSLDHGQVAQAISEAVGREISYQDIAPEKLKKGLLSAGLPADYVDFLILIFGFLREGYNAAVTDSVQKILGRAPRDIAAYARDARSAFGG